MITLDTPLARIQGIGPRFLGHLKNLRIFTVKDLLWHFPVRYEDFSVITPIAEAEAGSRVTIQGAVENVDVRRTWQRRMTVVEAIISDESGKIRVVWFNQPYIRNAFRPGRMFNFSGKVAMNEEGLYLSHPLYELVGRGESKHTGRLVPIYPETRGLTSKGLRFLVQPILKSVQDVHEWIPRDVLDTYRFPALLRALREVHFPDDIQDALAAKRRFAFEDLFLLQLWNLIQKSKLAQEAAPPIRPDIPKLKGTIGTLPFSLTLSQKKSLWEIVQDLEKPSPMNRLLQGDVGSGKTVVAALAGLAASAQGYQVAFMAPTEVLARQHFLTLQKLFRSVPREDQPAIGLLLSGEAKVVHESDIEETVKKPALVSKIKSGTVKIVVGTHALIQKSVAFANLGLVIVDEQHRFGVEQRAALIKANHFPGAAVPHFLSMSATPIPRTLMMTIFGDLDISTITELPSGRKPIVTKIVAPEDRPKAYAFIRDRIKKGRQAFVICPRIDPEEDARWERTRFALELKSVKEEHEKLSKKVFPDLRIAMLHGKMKSKEKEKIMRSFRDGKTDLLVSTSVIEVGVDVPNATIMMIEGSDRFGLAQLYQFRGRVGRGEHQSFCFLFTDSSAKATEERLRAILEAKNGFELAERDLQIRGPGEFIGGRQSGLPDFAMRGLHDIKLVQASRAAALAILSSDPQFKEHLLLAEKIKRFQKEIHLE